MTTRTTATRKTALVMEQATDVHGGHTWISVDEVTMETDFDVLAEAATLEEVLEQLRLKGYTDAYLYDVDEEQAIGSNLLAKQ